MYFVNLFKFHQNMSNLVITKNFQLLFDDLISTLMMTTKQLSSCQENKSKINID